MRALTVVPGKARSVAVSDVPEPPEADGALLVRALAVGICGTDAEIVEEGRVDAPDGADRLVIGHESLGRVLEAPDGSGFAAGDLVVGIVRRPDPVPCANCAAGEWDMCRNGRYTERGIKERHGYASERFRVEPEFAVRLDPGMSRVGVLLEPTSVVAKAWEHVERIGQRAAWAPRTVLVAGAGPVGLLAALLGVQRGYRVGVLDQAGSGPKPDLVRALGAEYHTDLGAVDDDADIVIECTGAPAVVAEVMAHNAPNSVVCLTGVSSAGRELPVDVGALNRSMVLQNDVVFGSVNANRRHFELAARALARADTGWLESVITRRVPLADAPDGVGHRDDDVKVVVEISDPDEQ